jgi:hypothetical protein
LHQLINHNRPLAALHTAAHCLPTVAIHKGLDSDIAASALEKAGLSPADHNDRPVSSQGYDIELLIKHLQSAEDIDADRLARVEWMDIHMFQRNNGERQTLISRIFNSPSFLCTLSAAFTSRVFHS